MRISKKELEAAITVTKNNKVVGNQSITQIQNKPTFQFYDVEGKLCSNDKGCLAKSISSSTGFEYFLQVNQRGQLLNPFSNQYRNESVRIARQQGVPKDKTFKFIKCHKIAFDNYLEFLRTKNLTFLNQAERGNV